MAIQCYPCCSYPLFLGNDKAFVALAFSPRTSVLVTLQVTNHSMIATSRALGRSSIAIMHVFVHCFLFLGTHLYEFEVSLEFSKSKIDLSIS